MNNSEIINAKEVAASLNINDLTNDIKAFNEILNKTGSSTMITNVVKENELYSYQPSQALMLVTEYLKKNYTNKEICLARFIRLMDVFLSKDKKTEMDRQLSDFYSFVFCQQFDHSIQSIK